MGFTSIVTEGDTVPKQHLSYGVPADRSVNWLLTAKASQEAQAVVMYVSRDKDTPIGKVEAWPNIGVSDGLIKLNGLGAFKAGTLFIALQVPAKTTVSIQADSRRFFSEVLQDSINLRNGVVLPRQVQLANGATISMPDPLDAPNVAADKRQRNTMALLSSLQTPDAAMPRWVRE